MKKLLKVGCLTACIIFMLSCNLTAPPPNEDDPQTDVSPPPVGSSSALDDPQPGNASQTLPPPSAISASLLQPADLHYLGAFRLPGEGERPQTFAYGGNAMTFNPNGDPSGGDDSFPGSLFISGHDRIAYGEVPDGSQIAEISIPAPVVSMVLDDLSVPVFIQDFTNVLDGHFSVLEEIPRMGMQFLLDSNSNPTLHIAFGQHMQYEPVPSHSMISADLSSNTFNGEWYIGNLDPYGINGYVFELPTTWSNSYANEYPLATGRMRDGGLAGMGPSLFAYQPFQQDGSPEPSGSHLDFLTLLLYESSLNTEELTHCLIGYQHPDEWEGGAFIENASGKQAVIFTGTKGTGDKFWYGYLNEADPSKPCVDSGVTDYVTCRMADGSSCPQSDFSGCCDEPAGLCATNRGWWSSRFNAQIIFYDPAQLAGVAAGTLEAWQPQPYARLDIDEFLLNQPPEWDRQMLGWGDQRRFRIGDVAYDRENGHLYILELFGDGAKPVVHVWGIIN